MFIRTNSLRSLREFLGGVLGECLWPYGNRTAPSICILR